MYMNYLTVLVTLCQLALASEMMDISEALGWLWMIPIANYVIIFCVHKWVSTQKTYIWVSEFISMNIAGIAGSTLMLIGSFPAVVLFTVVSVLVLVYMRIHSVQIDF